MSRFHGEDEHYVHHLFGFSLSCYLSGHVVLTCILENVKNFLFEYSAWTVRVPSVIQSPWIHVSPLVSRDGHVCYISFTLPHQSTLSTLNLIKEAHWKCLEFRVQEFFRCTLNLSWIQRRLSGLWLRGAARTSWQNSSDKQNSKTPLYKMLQ